MTDSRYSTLNQDDWKRTQVRMPQELYDMVSEYSQDKDLSLNSAMLELMENGMAIAEKGSPPANIKIIHLENGIKRVIFGKLVNAFDIDYKNPNLSQLRDDIEYCLKILNETGKLTERFMFFNKNVLVYQGNNHIDIVDNGKGSLNWLVVEDHHTQKYIEHLHADKKMNKEIP